MKGKVIQKQMTWILVFVMFLSVLMSRTIVFAENKDVKVNITSFNITNSSGVIPSGGYTSGMIFKLDYTWDASSYSDKLHEGDYFEIDLPDQFKFPKESSYCKFDVKAPNGEVLGNAVVSPSSSGGGKVKVTFTSYVNDKYDIKGDMHLTARWNNTKYPIDKESVFEIVVGSFHQSITLKPESLPNYSDEVLRKVSGQTLTEEGYVRWRIRINAKKANLTDVVLTDTLSVKELGSVDGIEYVDGQFILKELVIKDGKVDEQNPVNVSDKIKLSQDKRTFTYNMGTLDGKAYILHYRSTYKAGLILKNKAELKATDIKKVVENQFVDSSASGGGQGNLTSKIKIVKVDRDNEETRLKNAKFRVTKKDGSTSFDMTTNDNGEAISTQLIPGEYIIKEIESPLHYLLDETEYVVTVTSDKPAVKVIKNSPEEMKIKVKKQWIGKEKSDVTVILKADDIEVSRHTFSEPNWEHTFENLRKYKPGKTEEIVYTVKEENIPNGYTVSYSGNMKDGFVITNKEKESQIPWQLLTPGKTNLKVEKEWKGIDPKEAPEVTIYLVKNGVKTDKFIKLNKDNNWQGEFTNLDVVDDIKDKKANVYTIVEDGEINGKIVLDGKEYKVTYVGGKVVNTKVEKPVKPGQSKEPQEPKKPEMPKTPETPGKKTPDVP
ncbi:TPA: Cna B-type domain-containing protein, partial [Streptococcus equi subsp. zooepidemicus]|nr:Cna B-type domain-containing protein [Streptococcus equi subsp. zooepidemicus]